MCKINVIFKILVFPQKIKQTNKYKIIKETIIETFSWARQGLNLLLRISIRNGESGLHSSLKTIWKKILKTF